MCVWKIGYIPKNVTIIIYNGENAGAFNHGIFYVFP